MSPSFKDHKFSEPEQLWLNEVFESEDFDIRVAKVKLKDKLPKGFDPKNIDNRFLIKGKYLTMLGFAYIDPESRALQQIESTILAIKNLIMKNPGIETITAKQVSSETGIEESIVEIALKNLSVLGKFYSSATGSSEREGYSKIELSDDNDYDAYLEFENLDNLMEEYYKTYGAPSAKTAYFDTAEYATPSIPATLSAAYRYYPSLKTEKHEIKQDTAFVLMAMDPDKPELEDVYRAIKEVCASFGINAYRADEIEHQDRITDLILSEIKTCEVLIADLTHERPNVYYEIGYAHAVNKRPILYRKKGTRLHFDLSVHNVPEYKNVTELRELLIKRLEAVLGRSAK